MAPPHTHGKEINRMDIDTRTAIKAVYLHAFDSFATDPVTVEQEVDEIHNARHAREVLGILVNKGLLAVHDVNGDGDAWQVIDPGTYDEHSRPEAEAVIDKFLSTYPGTNLTPDPATPTPTKKASKPVPTNSKPIEFKHCLCGCDENVPPKSNFRPGHDARMAGQVARAMVAAGEIDAEILQTLPTEALRDKAMGIYDKAVAKAAAKVKPATEPVAPEPPKPTPPTTPKATTRKRAAKKASAKA